MKNKLWKDLSVIETESTKLGFCQRCDYHKIYGCQCREDNVYIELSKHNNR